MPLKAEGKVKAKHQYNCKESMDRLTKARSEGVLHPIRMTMPPAMAMRDLRVLSSPPQLVHFIPMQAMPRPATVTMMDTIMRARVAWRAPGREGRIGLILQLL